MTPAAATILLIDQDVRYARLIREALAGDASAAYRVVHTQDLEQGLEVLGDSGADLVLLDVSGADDSGIRALRAVLDAHPSLAVVVLSDVDDDRRAHRLVSAGAQDYLVKGRIHANVIVRVVRYTMERHRVLLRLRELDQLKSELVSIVSHEMRTPLAIVREFVALVLDRVAGPVTDEQRECLESALRNCDRMAALIDDLLDLSRIESGQLRLCRRRTDLRSLLEQCRRDFLPRCSQKGQTLALDLPARIPPALCDADRMLQVFVNLLGNAHKFTDSGGRITLRVRQVAERLQIEVEDDGIGIRPDDAERIFDAFTQIGRRAGPGTQGTGLGLTISRGIVELHGGDLTLDSRPGRGSCFRFTLPVYRPGSELGAFLVDRSRIHEARNRVATAVYLRSRGKRNTDPAWLRGIEEMLESRLRSQRDDMLTVESEGLVVLLLETNHEGCLAALRRLAAPEAGPRSLIADLEFAVVELPPPGAVDEVRAELPEFAPLSDLTRPRGPRRLLVVDDDPALIELIRNMLDRPELDLELCTTTSGYEACVRFGEFDPDLVILDLFMPDVDGRQVLRSMRGAQRTRAKFLVVSGYAERFEEMLALGCDDCLAKPFTCTELLDKVFCMLDAGPQAAAVPSGVAAETQESP